MATCAPLSERNHDNDSPADAALLAARTPRRTNNNGGRLNLLKRVLLSTLSPASSSAAAQPNDTLHTPELQSPVKTPSSVFLPRAQRAQTPLHYRFPSSPGFAVILDSPALSSPLRTCALKSSQSAFSAATAAAATSTAPNTAAAAAADVLHRSMLVFPSEEELSTPTMSPLLTREQQQQQQQRPPQLPVQLLGVLDDADSSFVSSHTFASCDFSLVVEPASEEEHRTDAGNDENCTPLRRNASANVVPSCAWSAASTPAATPNSARKHLAHAARVTKTPVADRTTATVTPRATTPTATRATTPRSTGITVPLSCCGPRHTAARAAMRAASAAAAAAAAATLAAAAAAQPARANTRTPRVIRATAVTPARLVSLNATLLASGDSTTTHSSSSSSSNNNNNINGSGNFDVAVTPSRIPSSAQVSLCATAEATPLTRQRSSAADLDSSFTHDVPLALLSAALNTSLTCSTPVASNPATSSDTAAPALAISSVPHSARATPVRLDHSSSSSSSSSSVASTRVASTPVGRQGLLSALTNSLLRMRASFSASGSTTPAPLVQPPQPQHQAQQQQRQQQQQLPSTSAAHMSSFVASSNLDTPELPSPPRVPSLLRALSNTSSLALPDSPSPAAYSDAQSSISSSLQAAARDSVDQVTSTGEREQGEREL